MTSGRAFLKGLYGVAPAGALASPSKKSTPVSAGRDDFDELGVESIINALAPSTPGVSIRSMCPSCATG